MLKSVYNRFCCWNKTVVSKFFGTHVAIIVLRWNFVLTLVICLSVFQPLKGFMTCTDILVSNDVITEWWEFPYKTQYLLTLEYRYEALNHKMYDVSEILEAFWEYIHCPVLKRICIFLNSCFNLSTKSMAHEYSSRLCSIHLLPTTLTIEPSLLNPPISDDTNNRASSNMATEFCIILYPLSSNMHLLLNCLCVERWHLIWSFLSF